MIDGERSSELSGFKVLELAVCASKTFQRAVNEGPTVIRDRHIYYDSVMLGEIGAGRTPKRPYVVLQAQQFAAQASGIGPFGAIDTLPEGRYAMLVSANSLHPGSTNNANHKRAHDAFVDFCGCLIDDIVNAAGRGWNLTFQRVEADGPAERLPETGRTSDNDYWERLYTFQTGLEAG